jgi:hypothetical protein
LYSKISEVGKQESQKFIDQFKEKLKKVAEEVIGDLYVDIPCYIESDSWSNFRNQIMDGFKNYNNRLKQNEFDFKEIRQQIFKDFKDDIIKDLDADLVKENEDLKKSYQILLEQYQSVLNRNSHF